MVDGVGRKVVKIVVYAQVPTLTCQGCGATADPSVLILRRLDSRGPLPVDVDRDLMQEQAATWVCSDSRDPEGWRVETWAPRGVPMQEKMLCPNCELGPRPKVTP